MKLNTKLNTKLNIRLIILLRWTICALAFAALSGCDHPANETNNNLEPAALSPLLKGNWEWTGHILNFKDGSTVVFDNWEYGYTFDETLRTGSIDSIGNFAIDDAGTSITFSNFEDKNIVLHFQKLIENELVGKYWAWGASLLQFDSGTTLTLRSKQYPYTYDEETRTGTVKPGKPQEGSLNEWSLGVTGLGDFVVDMDAEPPTVTFTDYKGQGAAASNSPLVIVFLEQDTDEVPAAVSETMVGTEWGVGQWEIFVTGDTAWNRSSTTFFINGYTYDPATKSGNIEFVNGFEVQSDDTILHFLSFKNYGHTLDFVRVD